MLKKIFYVVLISAIISNAYVHVNEMRKTRLNTIQIQMNKTMITVSNNLIADILKSHFNTIIDLYNRVFVLENEEPIIINKVEKQTPNFEKLMNGTVVIRDRGHSVAGVCIGEDETYYYILTVEHLLRDKKGDEISPKHTVPESNMGLAIKLEAIAFFLTDASISEKVTQERTIDTTVQNRDYISVAGEFMYLCSSLDLGLLRVYKGSGIKLEVIKIADTFPEVGDEIYVLGHPLGRKYNLSKGIVSNLDAMIFMGIDALMTWGNSGGGVFNTKGELIGICSRAPVYLTEREGNEEKDYYRYFIY